MPRKRQTLFARVSSWDEFLFTSSPCPSRPLDGQHHLSHRGLQSHAQRPHDDRVADAHLSDGGQGRKAAHICVVQSVPRIHSQFDRSRIHRRRSQTPELRIAPLSRRRVGIVAGVQLHPLGSC